MNKGLKLGIQSALWLISILLVVAIYKGINGPIEFQAEKTKRYEKTKEVLSKLRDVQLAYKQIKGEHADSFEKLFNLVANDEFVIIQKRDSVITYYDKIYRIDKEKTITLIDTLGTEKVIDRLFEGDTEAYQKLKYIPFSNEVEFTMNSGKLFKNGVRIPVFEIKAAKTDVLAGLDPDYVRQEEDAIDIKGNFIQIGSLTQATINGNW